jgi:UDP:flavonoid glycosyltransferase YjiC (YdhE family)
MTPNWRELALHITIATVGSRGDVQPYVALGAGLKAAGHSVCLATHAQFEAVIRSNGLDFSPIEGNPRETVESELGQQWLATGANMVAFIRRMAEVMRPMMVKGTADCLNACRGADLVVYSVLGWLAALGVAEKLCIPGYAAFLQPATPTKRFPSFAYPVQVNLGALHNRLTYALGEQMFWSMFRGPMNLARAEVLGLPKVPTRSQAGALRRLGLPMFYGYSSAVIPKPPDWPDNVHVTGYWFLDQQSDWQPPADLVEFLESGAPPVYVGFGSMHARSAEQLTATVVEALTRVGLRGVLLSGWGALSHNNLPDQVFPIEVVPHEWLFPRVAAVVHHGGAGTTAAGLRAGVPTIVTPFFGDQYFWGRRVAAVGAGPKPIPISRLTADRLAAALHTATSDERMQDSAKHVGETIRAEDGVARVVEVLERETRPAAK